MNTNKKNSELSNRIAHTSGSKTTMAPALLPTERSVIERLLMFSQQQADLAAAPSNSLAAFYSGVSFGYWASARAICEQRQISLAETERLCGAEPPTATKKGN